MFKVDLAPGSSFAQNTPIGAILAGVTADAFGLPMAMSVVASLTFISGSIAAFRMSETLHFVQQQSPA
jgi:hypothetical protein